MSTAPKWFKIVAGVALLWNLIGCLAFASDLMLTPEDVAEMSEAQQTLYETRPGWALAGTAVAVIGGALGCLGLLMGKAWSKVVLILSVLGLIAQDIALFVLVNGYALAGSPVLILQTIVLVIGICLVALSHQGIKAGWLT